MDISEARTKIKELRLDCHPDWVNGRFAQYFLEAARLGARFVAHSTYSTGVGRYWEVLCDELPGSALIYAKTDHDNPGEDAKSDCEKLNALLSEESSSKKVPAKG